MIDKHAGLALSFARGKNSTTDQTTKERTALFDNHHQTRDDGGQDATRARLLALLHRGQHQEVISSALQVSLQTIFNVKRCYLSGGFDAALFDTARAGRPIRIDGTPRARITALACSTPREGYARWSLRRLAVKSRQRKPSRSSGSFPSQRHEPKSTGIMNAVQAENVTYKET